MQCGWNFLFISMHLMGRLVHGEWGVKDAVTFKAIYDYLELVHYIQKHRQYTYNVMLR
jgi:hypothetical protein